MDYASRLASFCSWRVPSRFDRQLMVEAGFTFAPNKKSPDRVCCSFCGVYLCKWKNDDIPIHEHERYSPDCPFLKFKRDERVQYAMSKGKDEKEVFQTYKRVHLIANTPEEFLELVPTLGEASPATDYTCKVCMTENSTVLFLPCKHLCCCKTCVKSLIKCPICRCSPCLIIDVFV